MKTRAVIDDGRPGGHVTFVGLDANDTTIELPVDRLIGRRYRPEEINEAIDDMLANKLGRGIILFDGGNV